MFMKKPNWFLREGGRVRPAGIGARAPDDPLYLRKMVFSK